MGFAQLIKNLDEDGKIIYGEVGQEKGGAQKVASKHQNMRHEPFTRLDLRFVWAIKLWLSLGYFLSPLSVVPFIPFFKALLSAVFPRFLHQRYM